MSSLIPTISIWNQIDHHRQEGTWTASRTSSLQMLTWTNCRAIWTISSKLLINMPSYLTLAHLKSSRGQWRTISARCGTSCHILSHMRVAWKSINKSLTTHNRGSSLSLSHWQNMKSTQTQIWLSSWRKTLKICGRVSIASWSVRRWTAASAKTFALSKRSKRNKCMISTLLCKLASRTNTSKREWTNSEVICVRNQRSWLSSGVKSSLTNYNRSKQD